MSAEHKNHNSCHSNSKSFVYWLNLLACECSNISKSIFLNVPISFTDILCIQTWTLSHFGFKLLKIMYRSSISVAPFLLHTFIGLPDSLLKYPCSFRFVMSKTHFLKLSYTDSHQKYVLLAKWPTVISTKRCPSLHINIHINIS